MSETSKKPRSVLALGMFDGVHVGHQALLRQAAEAARALSARTVAFTFTDAPGKLLHLPVTSLSTPEQRIRWLQEAGAERVDIIPYDPDIRKYAANALLPAKVKSVDVDEANHALKVTVAGDQSKVAFGRKAQNVRLAAKVLGWTITLVPDEPKNVKPDMETQLRQAAAELAGLLEISEETARKFVDNGFITVDGVRAADPESLLSIEGIDPDEVQKAKARAGENA